MKKSLKRNVVIAGMIACTSSWSGKTQEVNVGVGLVSNYRARYGGRIRDFTRQYQKNDRSGNPIPHAQ